MLWMFLLLVLAQGEGPDKEEMKKFQGDWNVKRQQHGGKEVDAKENAKLRVRSEGATLTIREGDEVKEDVLVIRLAPKGKPAEIDLKIAAGPDLDKEIKAIYKFDKGELHLCFAEPTKARPKTFEGAKGTGHTLIVLTQAKAKKKQ